jgi:hypothetical protein
MLDPILVERDYQTLIHALRLVSSSRSRILHIVEFLEPLLQSSNLSYFAAYRRELLPRLCELLVRADLACTPPAFLQRSDRLLKSALSVCPELAGDEVITGARRHVEIARKKILEWGDSRATPGFPLRVLDEDVGKLAPDASWVLLVEREPVVPTQSGRFALLRQLQVEVLYADSSQLGDVVYMNRRADLGGLEYETFQESLRAAKGLYQEFTGSPLKRSLRVYCTLNDPHLIGGASLGPALAMLVFCELIRLKNLRGRFAMSPGAAITGRITGDGRILPIDEAGLERKLEAGMYSWLRVLVVPREQEEGSTTILSRLASEEGAPSPPEVVSVGNLREILMDRRLTTAKSTPFIAHLAQRLWGWRRALAAALIAGLALAVSWQSLALLDRTPVDAIFTSHEIAIRNQFGETVETIPVGPSVPPAAESYYRRAGARLLALFDAEGDGTIEIVWADARPGTPASLSAIQCKTIGEDSVRWTYDLRRSLKFLRNNDVHSDLFGAAALMVRDIDGDGGLDVLVAANHELFFPSLLVRLDAREGKESASYVHIGHLLGVLCADTDADGREEVVTFGTNNAFNMAAIAVFEPESIGGHSPLTPEYALDSVRPGTECQYLLIPRTIVGASFADKARRNAVSHIVALAGQGLIRADIMDVGYHLGDPDQVLVSSYAYFGKDLVFAGFSAGDDFDLLAEQLLAQGKIVRKPDKAYFEEWGKSLRYWNGETWEASPVKNRLYLRQCDHDPSRVQEEHPQR